MPRQQRICLVAALAIMVVGVVVAFVGGPLVAAVLMPMSLSSPEPAAITASVSKINNAAEVAGWCFLLGMAVAAVSGIYSLVSIAAWFIGRADEPAPSRTA